MPDDGQWRDMQSILEGHTAGWMLWEGQPLPAAVERLEALDIRSLVSDPCGNRPEKGHFLSVMRGNAAQLRLALEL